jgi:ABC-type transport system involved in multi-copper enzyme maturation permease subunit
MRAVLRLFRAEMTKIWRTKFPYFGLLASALVAVIAKQIVDRNELADEATMSGYLSVALNLCSTLVAPIFVVIFAAMLVSSETSRGTYRMVLPRPISRSAFLTSKLLTGLLYMILVFASNLAVAVPLAMRYPLHSASDSGTDVPGAAQQASIYATAVLLTLIPHAATVCFGFLISVLSVNVGTAIGVAVGVLLSLLPMSVFIQFGSFRLRDWLFSEHFDTAIGIASERAQLISGATWDQAKVYSLLATSAISIVVFLVIIYGYFTRRDLNL